MAGYFTYLPHIMASSSFMFSKTKPQVCREDECRKANHIKEEVEQDLFFQTKTSNNLSLCTFMQ